jgi:glyoxylase-like metal-dependent hydrolase (beta-lactamase superfamily II)
MTSVVTRLARYVILVRAANPGPMTLDGTNTWILGDPRQDAPVVVDPGPLIAEHLDVIMDQAGGRIAEIVLTHRHLDHSESTATLAARAGCRVRAADREFRIGAAGLGARDRIELPGAILQVVETPGHTSDSRSLMIIGDDSVTRLLAGDMVLGRGTTVIMHPDGNLGAYLDSLAVMQALVAERGVSEILPGHGPVVSDPAAWLGFYREHRMERLDQVRAALAAGDRSPEEVVARVYADVDRTVWPAATLSVRAQLDYLAALSDP